MDLPTCPTCGQSVLDEDAVDCPFCGAALKGGKSPSKGGPPRKPIPKIVPRNVPVVQTPVEPEAKTAGSSASGPKSVPAVTSAKAAPAPDEDPFAVDQSQHAGAIPVQPRKSAGKTLEVVCPMCETHGFVSMNAAGKQVRCCNPKCLVPVFEAAAPRKEAPPPPPPPPKPIGKWIVGALLILAAGGAFYFWWMHRNDLDNIQTAGFGTVRPTKKGGDDTRPSVADNVKVPEKENTPAEWQKQSLSMLIELARSPNNGRKATCRRLSATDAIAINDLTQAQQELDQMAKVARQALFEAVPPLTLMAWKHWEAGRKPEFLKTVDAAVQAAAKLPEKGRHGAQSAVALAAVLALAGRDADGHALVAKRQNGEPLDELAALYEIVFHDGTFDLDRTFPGQATGRWERPLSTAVTYVLMLHGQREIALRWAESDPDQLARTESLLLWATLVSQQALPAKQETELAQAAEVAAKLSPAAQAIYQTRLADLQRKLKNQAAGLLSLLAAEKLLAGDLTPQPVRISSVKDLLAWNPPANATAILASARAAAELAVAQASFGPPQNAAAEKSLKLALNHLRSLAPSRDSVQAVQSALMKGGEAGARQELRRLYSLESVDETTLKLNEFKNARLRVQKAADLRFRQQTQLLNVAVKQGLIDAVAQEIESHVAADDPNDRESYLETALPQLLVTRLAAAGKGDRKLSLQKLIGNEKPNPDNLAPLALETAEQLVADGKGAEAAAALNPHLKGDGTLHQEALRLACRLTKAKKFEPVARDFLGAINDEQLREDGLRLTAALATLGYEEKLVFKAAESETDRHAVAASLFSGLIEGLSRRPELPATKEPPAGKAAKDGKAAVKGK